MLITGITASLFLLAYSVLILYYRAAWQEMIATGEAKTSVTGPPLTVTVIVPARNEAASIGACLDAILSQDYPKELVEIVVVDDDSDDKTAFIASCKHGVRVILMRRDEYGKPIVSFKKAAIESGIRASKGELIVCTDADCVAGKGWLSEMVRSFRNRNDTMLAGPVRILENGSALAVFQVLDFISLQGITGAALFRHLYPMANGANLAYSRTAFETVGGFAGIDHIASGDDMLLMKKMQDRFPQRQSYIQRQEAIVSTLAAGSLRGFFRQRIRWASKTMHYGHAPTVITLALVYGLNLLLLILFGGCCFYGGWAWLLVLLAGKTTIEMLFVSPVAAFFGQRHLMKYFPLCQPFHIIYTVFAGTFGALGKTTWKGRVVR